MAEKVNMPSQKKEKKKKRKKKLPSDFYDYNLLACTILLVSFGLIMLYSASAYEAASTFKGNDMYYFTHQADLSILPFTSYSTISAAVPGAPVPVPSSGGISPASRALRQSLPPVRG